MSILGGSKRAALFIVALSGVAALIAGTQGWVTFSFADVSDQLAPTGSELNAALTPLALALVAAALALTIAGRVFRIVLGILIVGLGVGIGAFAVLVVGDPGAAIAGQVTELTGIVHDTGAGLVEGLSLTPWVWVTAAAGSGAVIGGIMVLATSHRWASSGRRFESEAATAGASDDRISDWDALSQGEDPSEDFR